MIGFVANLGGQIRHTEIRGNQVSAPASGDETPERNHR